MPNPEYFLSFDEHRARSLTEFAVLIRGLQRKPVGTIQLSELCSMADYPNGIYLFFERSGDLRYVGKSTSRSFIERISSHFDQRPDAWFATLPRKVLALSQMASYADAHAQALQFELVLIGVKSGVVAARLENALRTFLKPSLNTRRASPISGEELLSSFEF